MSSGRYVGTRESAVSAAANYFKRGMAVGTEAGSNFPTIFSNGASVVYLEVGLHVVNAWAYENSKSYSDFVREDYIIGLAVEATSGQTFVEYALGG